MKAILIEDEKAAVKNLIALLDRVAPEITVVKCIDNIVDSIEYFSNVSDDIDLVFMDICLADGSAFEIFEHVSVDVPIIFTTAYDEYALKAFKVNGIDYLLKPIGERELSDSLNKLKRLTSLGKSIMDKNDIINLINDISGAKTYKNHFLVPIKGDKLIPIDADDIMLFYISDNTVKAILENGKEYIFYQTLDEILASLNPRNFFRVNRQYIISRKAVSDIDLWFNGRLSVNLKIKKHEKILVSKTRVTELKEWFNR